MFVVLCVHPLTVKKQFYSPITFIIWLETGVSLSALSLWAPDLSQQGLPVLVTYDRHINKFMLRLSHWGTQQGERHESNNRVSKGVRWREGQLTWQLKESDKFVSQMRDGDSERTTKVNAVAAVLMAGFITFITLIISNPCTTSCVRDKDINKAWQGRGKSSEEVWGLEECAIHSGCTSKLTEKIWLDEADEKGGMDTL